MTDAEELEVEGGQVVLCCDIISECGLTAEHIDAQVEQLARLAEKWMWITTAGAPISKTRMPKMKMMKMMTMLMRRRYTNHLP